MRNKLVEFLEGALVEKQCDAFARREFAGLVLAFAAFQSAAGFRLGAAAAQVFEAVFEDWVVGHGVLSSRLSHRLELVRH